MNSEDTTPNNNFLSHDENYSFKELFYIFSKHRKILVSTVLFCVIISLLMVFIQQPIYYSSSMIMIEDQSSTMDIFEMGLEVEKNYIQNEIQIIKSLTTSERAVRSLLDSEHINNLYLFNTREYNSNILSNWIYQTPVVSLISSNVSDRRVTLLAKRLQRRINLQHQRNTDILSISIESVDPFEAALLVNTLVQEYRLMDMEWVTGEMFHLKTFLIEQIEKKELELSQSEDELKLFQKEEKIFGIDDNSKLILQNLINAETQLHNAKAENNILNERKRYIQGQLTSKEKNLSESVSNSISDRLSALKGEIATKEAELISASTQQGEDHQIVKNLKIKLDKLKNNLEKETRTLISQGMSVADPIKFRQELVDSVISFTAIIAMLDTKEIELQKLVDKYESRLSSLPEKVLEFSRLSRNLSINSDTYSLMRQKLDEARINEASQIGNVRIIDEAKPNLSRISPRKRYNILLGLVFGLVFAVSLILLIEYFDQTIKSLDQIDKLGLTVLAIIPSIGESDKSRRKKTKKYQKLLGDADKIQRRMVTQEDPKSPVSEAYRSLRTSLVYSTKSEKSNSNVILVSSPGPGEGKTTTIVNLAITYANLGKRTILLDTDLRKPVVHKVFSIDREPGITRYLSGLEEDHTNIINKTDVKNLDVVTCGVVPPNPSELLSSQKMELLVEKLNKEYDVVLFDSPPLLAVTDSFISMKYASQFILVIRCAKTEKGALNRSLQQLELANAPFKGVVMNAIDVSNSYGGYYYNYYQYYYGGDE